MGKIKSAAEVSHAWMLAVGVPGIPMIDRDQVKKKKGGGGGIPCFHLPLFFAVLLSKINPLLPCPRGPLRCHRTWPQLLRASEDLFASTPCTALGLIAVIKVALDGTCCDRKQLYANKRLRKCE